MSRRFPAVCLFLLLALFCVAIPSSSQDAGAVLRLRVRVKVGESTKGLLRKRFYLIKGSLEQNKALVEANESRLVVSRDCYYRSAGASEALIAWLKDGDCESVYCREIETDDLEGAGSVPEFVTAAASGEKEFGSRELARKWLTVNLPEKLRDGFYKVRQTELQAAINQAEQISGAKVRSVMTDRYGTAYFTEVEPGTYTLSNMIATEIGGNAVTWNCQVQIKPDDRAFEKAYVVANFKDKSVKCVAVERPLPACRQVK